MKHPEVFTTRGWRKTGIKSLGELTAQEMRIARLWATGATNREIAETMFVSRLQSSTT